MQNLFSAFDPVSSKEWINKIVQDLKGKELSTLDFNDPIEEIEFRAFHHKDDAQLSQLLPGDFPATRGSKSSNNQWNNGIYLPVENESATNKKALNALMTGADLLYFDDCGNSVDWKTVLDGIQLEHIKGQFRLSTSESMATILDLAGEATSNISFCFEALESANHPALAHMKATQTGTFVVNGYGVFHCGGNASQEIAFCLATGHQTLVNLMDAGFSVDQASAMIHFHLGVGNKYFNEIAKFRALRMLWSKVIDAYQPEHACTLNCQITAIIGLTNKSLKDPYTNLLRQTTEVMSAAHSADSVVVLPYDHFSTSGASELAQRMALNISLILKEESYLHFVADPVGGSYSIEGLTNQFAQKAWEMFQKLEKEGGIGNKMVLSSLQNEVAKTREIRESRVASGTDPFIGINKYPDPKAKEATWIDVPGYLDMQPFIADLITQNETV